MKNTMNVRQFCLFNQGENKIVLQPSPNEYLLVNGDECLYEDFLRLFGDFEIEFITATDVEEITLWLHEDVAEMFKGLVTEYKEAIKQIYEMND